MEMKGEAHRQDGPRELEIFSDEQVEDVMESLEYFKAKIEQLQLYCEQVNQSKLRSDEALLDEKRKNQTTISKYQDELNLLRSINIQLMSGKIATADKKGNLISSLNSAIEIQNAECRIQELESQVQSLELTSAEKDKHISVMEWQLMDMEATIAALQAERDQLILELELREVQENVVQGNEHFQPMGGEGDDVLFHEDNSHPNKKSKRSKNSLNAQRPHSDVWGAQATQENRSLKQLLSLSAEWTVNETPVRMRKPPQRHYSDYVKRDARSRSNHFAHGNTTHSLEDFDTLSEVDSGLGLGKLTRTTNFCDILDADEYSNVHVADNRLSFTGDSVLSEQLNNGTEPETESSRESLEKKWEIFELGKKGDINPPDNQNVPGLDEAQEAMFDEQSFGSSLSDFSSAFCSSQDLLMSSSDEPWKAASSPEEKLSSVEPNKNKLSKKNSKSDSCIISSKSPPLPEDMWNFTPDSILNVSTGEVLIPSVIKTPPSPSLKKSRSFTSSLDIILKPSDNNTTDENQGSESEKTDEASTPTNEEANVTLRTSSGESSRSKHDRKSKSVILISHHICADGHHKKSLSDPVKDDRKSEPRKLTEYQKWRKYGRKGKPPGDLKISDC